MSLTPRNRHVLNTCFYIVISMKNFKMLDFPLLNREPIRLLQTRHRMLLRSQFFLQNQKFHSLPLRLTLPIPSLNNVRPFHCLFYFTLSCLARNPSNSPGRGQGQQRMPDPTPQTGIVNGNNTPRIYLI
jgi:hypothetical protein